MMRRGTLWVLFELSWPPRLLRRPSGRTAAFLSESGSSRLAPERAGEVLAGLVLGTMVPPPGRIYASLVRGELTFSDPSELARNDEARDRLWRESADMVGIA